MRVIKIPVQNASASGRIKQLRNDVESALQNFCHQRLLETKLVGPTFSYRFTLSPTSNTTTDRSEIKKGLVRLKELFRRDIEKSIPYIEHAREPLLNIKNRQTYTINLVSWAESSGIDYTQFIRASGATRKELVKETSFGRLMQRYARYLQFLCLKYGAPFCIRLEYEMKLTDECFIKAQQLSPAESETYRPEYHYVISFNVDPVYWTPRIQMGVRVGGVGALQTNPFDVIRTRLETETESAVYSLPGWIANYVANGRYHQPAVDSGFGKYWMAERIFLHIDSIRQILKTLSRKTSYAPTAFSIRTTENT